MILYEDKVCPYVDRMCDERCHACNIVNYTMYECPACGKIVIFSNMLKGFNDDDVIYEKQEFSFEYQVMCMQNKGYKTTTAFKCPECECIFDDKTNIKSMEYKRLECLRLR